MSAPGERLTSEELSALIVESLATGRRVHVGFTDAVLLDTPENAWARMLLERWRRAEAHDTTDEDTQPIGPVTDA